MNVPTFHQSRETWSYSGRVWNDDDGRARVSLANSVRAHRAGFDDQLTPASSSCVARVIEEIANGRFAFATPTRERRVSGDPTPGADHGTEHHYAATQP